MNEKDVNDCYLAVKEHIYQLVSTVVKGKVSVYFDKDKETFTVEIMNGDFRFKRDIYNAWLLITTNGITDKAAKEVIASYKSSIMKYYFK